MLGYTSSNTQMTNSRNLLSMNKVTVNLNMARNSLEIGFGAITVSTELGMGQDSL